MSFNVFLIINSCSYGIFICLARKTAVALSQTCCRSLRNFSVAGSYPLVCAHQKTDRFVGLLVPANSPRDQTGLIRGTSRRNPNMWSPRLAFDAKYEYTLGDWSPKQVLATSPCDQYPTVCLALQLLSDSILNKVYGWMDVFKSVCKYSRTSCCDHVSSATIPKFCKPNHYI